MLSYTVERALDITAELGEAPAWSVADESLLRGPLPRHDGIAESMCADLRAGVGAAPSAA